VTLLVTVGVTEAVGVGVIPADGETDGVIVTVGDGVILIVGVTVGVTPAVGDGVTVAVTVGVTVGLAVTLGVTDCVGVGVGVFVAVTVGVGETAVQKSGNAPNSGSLATAEILAVPATVVHNKLPAKSYFSTAPLFIPTYTFPSVSTETACPEDDKVTSHTIFPEEFNL